MSANAAAVHAAAPVDHAIAQPADDPWVRWTQGGGYLYGIVDARGHVELSCRADAVDEKAATLPDGTSVAAQATAGGIRVDLPSSPAGAPAVVRFPLR
jgi:alpha-L-fucosidase